jgi:hypothetical protein
MVDQKTPPNVEGISISEKIIAFKIHSIIPNIKYVTNI